MILMRFRHLLPGRRCRDRPHPRHHLDGIGPVGPAAPGRAKPAPRNRLRQRPRPKPGTPAAAAQKPAATAKPASGKPAPGKPAAAAPSAGPGRGSRDPAGLVRGLGRLHGPVRPDQDLLRPDPAQGPAAQDGNPRSGLPVRVVPPGGERQERGRLRDGLPDQGQRRRPRPRSAPPTTCSSPRKRMPG